MHCTDEDLVAYLDGELNPLETLRIYVHLKRCWDCRAHLASCEREIQRLTEGMREWVDPGPEWMLDSKWRLARGMKKIEAALPQAGRVSRRAVWIAVGASCAALVVAGLFSLPTWRQRTTPTAREAISRAATAEEQLFRDPVQQEVTVEIEETRPKRVSRRGRVQAMSDQVTGRFATNWTGSDGASKFALWRPSVGTTFEWVPARQRHLRRTENNGGAAITLTSLADGGLDPKTIEMMFLRWLASRAWRPISFSSDLSVWSRQNGTVMMVERVQDEARAPTIRVTAQRTDSRRVRAVVTLEFDAATFRPRLQKLRFESADAEVELRLVSMEARVVRRTDLRDSVFQPPASLAGPETTAITASPRRDVPIGPQPGLLTAEVASRKMEKITREVHAHFALHRAGVCLGVSVEIIETPTGVMVRRRSPKGEEHAEIAAVGSSLADVLGALADLRAQPGHRGPTEGLSFEAGNSEQITALEELAERFPAQSVALMDATARRLFERMTQSHRRSISAELSPAERQRLERLDQEFRQKHSNLMRALQK